MKKKYRSAQQRRENPNSYAELYGYTHKNFKAWGKSGGLSGGRPRKWVNNAEKCREYRKRKKLKLQGLLNDHHLTSRT